MTEPRETPPPPAPETGADPPAEPFEPGPAELSGCGKPAVIGCLVMLVVLAAGLILLVGQSPKLMRFLMRTMEEQVMAALPEDFEEAERQRLTAAFDGAVAALEEGRFDTTSMSNLQRLSALMPKKDQTLGREQVAEIVQLLEELGAVSGPQGSLWPEFFPGRGERWVFASVAAGIRAG